MPGLALGHGAVDEEIRATTQAIKHEPKQPALYLKRGELHRTHGEYLKSLADLNRAQAFAPLDAEIALARARTLHAAGRLKPARQALDRLLVRKPSHTGAWLQRARVATALQQPLAAAHDYSRVIALQQRPALEPYLERAQALRAAGPSHWHEAAAGIEEAISRLGPLVTLELEALDLECALGRFDLALERVDAVILRSARKEAWYARKAVFLADAGRDDEARSANLAALQSIEALPPHLSSTPATQALSEQVRARLDAGR